MIFNPFKKKRKPIFLSKSNFTYHDTLIVVPNNWCYNYFLMDRNDKDCMFPITINRITSYPHCECIGISYNYISFDGQDLGEVKTARIEKISFFDKEKKKYRIKPVKRYDCSNLPYIPRCQNNAK